MIYLLAPLILIPVSCYLIRLVWVRYQEEQHLSKLKRVADARKIDDLSTNIRHGAERRCSACACYPN